MATYVLCHKQGIKRTYFRNIKEMVKQDLQEFSQRIENIEAKCSDSVSNKGLKRWIHHEIEKHIQSAGTPLFLTF